MPQRAILNGVSHPFFALFRPLSCPSRRYRLWLRPHHIVEVLLSPSNERFDGRNERFADIGEPILHTRRHLRVDSAVDEVALPQLFERFRQHLLRAVDHVGVQFVKAHHPRRARVQRVYHEHRPLVAKPAYHLADGAGEIFRVDFFLRHNRLYLPI